MGIRRGVNFPLDFPFHRRTFIRPHLSAALQNLGETTSSSRPAAARQLLALVDRETNQTRSSGDFMSLGLLQEIYTQILRKYCKDNPSAFTTLLQTNRPLMVKFRHNYPVEETRNRLLTDEEYLNLSESSTSSIHETFFEYLYISAMEKNPAARKFSDLFSSPDIKKSAEFTEFHDQVDHHFADQPKLLAEEPALTDFLLRPIEASPDDLYGQLEYIFRHWSSLLPQELMMRILLGLDLIREERSARGGVTGVDLRLPNFTDQNLFPEHEAFTEDRDWMPKVTLIAKSTYVWLYQLSKSYKSEIKTLDQIPDKELDKLSRWGFTGLWLIGIWRRSPASARIKKLAGNTDAISSAYSLFNYEIADELGGDLAWENLRTRAAARGIRLAADMVPNHTGLYSDLVLHHPEMFLSLPYSPFPNYRFDGPNLSEDPNIEIKIEDGYYSKSDAAVVFRRTDLRNGETRYIYHGNDGTSMPWNDTAQLDYLSPETREEIIRQIMHVAAKFQIIRFDAAMTLAKKHIQRLWHPEPGTGGAIPSRSEHALKTEDFHKKIPHEFWREVVDRINAEMPDTLLLAEAFWMMEGYFVRTLGMHRVYNSAFMNMLKREENKKYREYLKETLEFNPEILRRYVNFMSNPDEDTAVAQFSKGDKYFGVATLMVTMPGLPMWGHGQIEGFAEKYGMEYSRAYYDEYPDNWLIERHEREIFPLMRKRHLFAGVEYFTLYDFVEKNGSINENVFAYSNRSGAEKALIIFNNAFADTVGHILHSVPFNSGKDDSTTLRKTRLHKALNLKTGSDWFLIFRDARDGQEFIRRSSEIESNGLFVMLGAYGLHAFIDMREIQDHHGWLEKLCQKLNGGGVPSMENALADLQLEPLTEPLKTYLPFTLLQDTISACVPHIDKVMYEKPAKEAAEEILSRHNFSERFERSRLALLPFHDAHDAPVFDHAQLLEKFSFFISCLRQMQPEHLNQLDQPAAKFLQAQYSKRTFDYPYEFWRIPLLTFFSSLHENILTGPLTAKAWLPILKRILAKLGAHESQAAWEAKLILTLTEIRGILDQVPAGAEPDFLQVFTCNRAREFISVHAHREVLFFHKESGELLAYWVFHLLVSLTITDSQNLARISEFHQSIEKMIQAMGESEYKFNEWLASIEENIQKYIPAKSNLEKKSKGKLSEKKQKPEQKK